MKANGQASHKYLKALAGEMGADVSDLIALSYDNDPYYIGRPSHRELAEWFQGIWRQRGFEGRGGVHLRRVHLRRVHYQLLGAAKHDGRPYENITTDWNYLLKASRYARILGLVNPEDIIDRRNPEPHVYFYRPDDEQEKGFEPHIPGFDLPAPDTDLLSWLEENLKHPHLSPTGYDYDDFSQPYHVEVWVEKSTMNDILQPLCEELSTNLAVGASRLPASRPASSTSPTSTRPAGICPRRWRGRLSSGVQCTRLTLTFACSPSCSPRIKLISTTSPPSTSSTTATRPQTMS
jgi:hypothetical protein